MSGDWIWLGILPCVIELHCGLASLLLYSCSISGSPPPKPGIQKFHQKDPFCVDIWLILTTGSSVSQYPCSDRLVWWCAIFPSLNTKPNIVLLKQDSRYESRNVNSGYSLIFAYLNTICLYVCTLNYDMPHMIFRYQSF